jgi:hypothetical protein
MEAFMNYVVPAIISATGAVLVCIINSHYQASTTRNLIEYKLNELTKRVEKHNNVIERVYELEKHSEVVDEKIDVANHRIKDLEEAK